MPERLPQRFRYKKPGCRTWDYGVCMPVGQRWRAIAGFGRWGFEDNPWEVMGQLIGDVDKFEWIDTDYGWAGDMRKDSLVAKLDRYEKALLRIQSERNQFEGPSLEYMQGYRDGQQHLVEIANKALVIPQGRDDE